MTLVPRIVESLRENDLGDVLIMVGGIIPEDDIPILADVGVAKVFTPGTPLQEVSSWLEVALDERERAQQA